MSTRKRGCSIGLVFLAVIAAVVIYASAYTLDETEQAVVLQFGNPVGEPSVPFVIALNKIDTPQATEENIRKIYCQLA